MAFTGVSLASVAKALKLYYLEGLRLQINDRASVLLAQLERNEESVVGSKIVMALRYGRVGGIGMRADTGDMPTPNGRKTLNAEWETKNMFARFRITDKSIEASRTSRGAFVNLLEQEIKDCETDVKQDISRQMMGNTTGLLTNISGVKSTLTVPVTSTLYLAEGMLVDIYDPLVANDYVNTGVEITGVDVANSTVTLSAVGTVANGHQLFVAGNKGLEITGLKSIFEDTSLYGLSRTTYPMLSAQRVNVNGNLSEVIIQKAIDEAELRAGANTNFMMCSHGVRRAYQALLTAQKQIVNSMELKGGWKTLEYNGIALAADKYVPAGKMFALDLEDFALYSMGDFNWMDRDGSMFVRVANKAAYEATMVRYCDIGCQRPKGQVELYGITEA